MKRFLKIFGICFASMICIFAATYGVLLLVGYFDDPKISPKDIAFEVSQSENNTFILNNEIYATNDFYITITTTTENVTKKEIELSLDGTSVDELENSGKISNGIIIIPSKVNIGEKFLVEPAKSYQQLGFDNNIEYLDWIIGGHSTITAKSVDNLELRPQSIKVHIDVPVHSIKATAVATETSAENSDNFSIGTNFIISAEFSPANSKYYFLMNGQNGYEEITKKVYVSENSNEKDFVKRISEDNLQQNIFTSLKVTNAQGVNLTAYTFQNSKQQYEAEREYLDVNEITQTYTDDQIYAYILNSLSTGDYMGIARHDIKNLHFKKLTDLSYSMTNETSESYKVNQILTWFVNYNNNSALSKNLQLNFVSATSDLDVQSEVQKLGVQILKSDGQNFNLDASIKPYNYGKVEYLAYSKITNGENYISLEEYMTLNETERLEYNVSYLNENDYNSLLDAERKNYFELLISQSEYDLITDNSLKDLFTPFYFAEINKNNIDLSSWQFTFNQANLYKVRFKFFSTESTIVIPDKYIDITVSSTTSLPVDFDNINPVELKVNYTKVEIETPDDDEEEVQNEYTAKINEYDISKYNSSSNLIIPSNNEYTTVRYFVFADKDVEESAEGIGDLTQYIESTKTNNQREFGSNYVYLYEIEDGILKFKAENFDKIKDVTFYVSFATVKTDINGTIIKNYDANQIYSYNIDQQSTRYIQVTVKDTLKDINVTTSINEELLNIDYFEIVKDENSYLAILQNKQNIINLTLEAVDNNQTELLEKEIKNGNIKIIAVNGNIQVTDQILSINNNVDNVLNYNISTKILTGQDTKFNLYVDYIINNKTYNVLVGDISEFEVFSGEASQVHFGKETVTGEGEEESITNYGEIIKIEREKNNPIKTTKVFGEVQGNTTISQSYKLVGDNNSEIITESELKAFLFNVNGELQFTFEDKYGRTVDSGIYSLETSNPEVMTVTDKNFTFLKSGICELRLVINNQVKDVLLLEYEENSAELSVINVNSEDNLKTVYNVTNDINEYDFSKTIETSFVGAMGDSIAFEVGAERNGLLEIYYRQADETAQGGFVNFDFSREIKYTFETTPDAELLQMLNIYYEEETNNIQSVELLANFVTSARIRIKAKIDILNLEQIIEVLIKPNVVINYNVDYPTTNAQNVTDGSNTYIGVYGDTEIKVTLSVTQTKNTVYNLYDQADTALQQENGTFVYTYRFNEVNDFEKVVLQISDDANIVNKYRFVLNLYYNINPNIQISKTHSVSLNGRNEINLFATDNDNLNTIEVTRIRGDEYISANNLTVLGEIQNGTFVELGSDNSTFTYSNNTLTLKDSISNSTKLRLVLGSMLNCDTYNNIRVGASLIEIGESEYYYVEIEILPFINYDLTSNNYIQYNGKTYLKLISDTTYNYSDLTEYFTVDDDYTVSIEGVEQILQSTYFDINDNKIIVSELYNIQGVNESFYLKVKAEKGNSVHTLSVPIIFLPMDVPYLQYEYNNNSKDLNDLLSVNWLKNNNAILDYEIIAGQKVDLSDIFAEDFELDNYNYSIVNEDNKDTLYAKVDKNEDDFEGTQVFTYTLDTQLVDSDKIIVLIARRKVLGSSSASVIEIPVRLKITNGLGLNLYYPYGENAEYVVFGNNNSKIIDLEQELNSYIPNRSSNNTRFELVNKTDNATVELADYQNKYSFAYDFRVENGTLAKYNYASINGSILTLNKVNETDYSVIVTISVKNSAGDIILSKDYTFNIIDGKTFIITPSETSFKLTEETEENINFTLQEQKGLLIQTVTNKLKFYIANGQGIVNAVYDNNAWKIVAGSTVVNINASLVAYTEYGEVARFNVLVETTKPLSVNDINADDENEMSLTVEGNDSVINSITLNSIIGTNTGIIENNVAKYIDNFSNTSTISVVEKDGTFYLSAFPFTEDVTLNLSIEFTYEGQTAVWTGDITVNKDLSSLVSSPVEDASAVEITAGTNATIDTTSLFEGSATNYTLNVEAIQNQQLVEITGNLVRFKNSAVGGIVTLQVIYSHNDYENYKVISYVKYNVEANISYTITYPAGMQKEYLPSGSEIVLTEENIFGDTRFDYTVSEDETDTSKTISYEVDRTDGVDCEINGEKISLNLIQGYSIGNVVISILYGNNDNKDNIAYYYIEVRKSWSDIFKANMLNIDGSSNLEANPEIFLNEENYKNNIVLDVADYDNKPESLKNLVLGAENNKSTFVYYIDASKQESISADKLTFTIDNTFNNPNEQDNSTLTAIDVLFNNVKIDSYYVKFEFKVKFNYVSYTISPDEKNNVKDMFGIECNENYNVTILQEGSAIKYSIYQYNGSEYINADQYKGKNCITFENNETNPEVAGWGAPNDGLRFEYTIIVSYGKFDFNQAVNTLIYPKYTVEHNSETKVTNDMFAGEESYKLVLATADVNTSTVKVYKALSQENLLVKESSNWTIISSNEDVVSDNGITKNTSEVSLSVKKSSFGIKETKITFEDKYGYTFDYLISVVPDTNSIPKFNTSSLSAYENEILDLSKVIANNSLINANNENTTVTLIREDYDDIELKGDNALSSFALPYVDSTQTGTIKATIYSANSDESTTIQIPITINKRYSLSLNEKYLQEGIVYYREGQELNLLDLFYIQDSSTGIRAGERSLIATKSLSFTNTSGLSDLEDIMFVQANNLISLTGESLITLRESIYNEGISNINITNRLNQIEGISNDATNYDYIVSVKYENEDNYSTLRLFGNSSPELVLEENNYYLRIGTETNKLEEGSYIAIWIINNSSTYNVVSLSNLQDYRFGENTEYYYIPFTKLSSFDVENDYNYYAFADVGDNGIAKLLTNENYESSVSVVDDKVLKVHTINDTGKTVKIKLFKGNENIDVEIELNGGIFEKSLRQLDCDIEYELLNNNEYIDGLNNADLKLIKGISINEITKDEEGNENSTNKDIYSTEIKTGLVMETYPYFEQSQLKFKINFGGENGKVFDSNIVLRTIPPVAYVANQDNNIEWSENNLLKVAIGEISVSGNTISGNNWMDLVNILDENKEFLSTLTDLEENGFTLSYSVKEGETAKGQINSNGNITLSSDFDYTVGHITIVISVSNSNNVYNVPIGEIIILPRLQQGE